MLKRTYDWCIDAADKPYALWIPGGGILRGKLVLPNSPRSCCCRCRWRGQKRLGGSRPCVPIASVAGGVLGYAIGALLRFARALAHSPFTVSADKVETFRASYAEWGAVIILVKGLTPIPYKLVTITSGFAGYNIWLFILCSIVARGGRFFVVAILLNRYGDPDPSANWKSASACGSPIGAVVLVLGFVIAFKLI